MSIATAIQGAQAKVAAAYSKCNDKGATMPVTQDLDHLDDCIDSIPTGGVEEKDVVFYDYDGTILYSYTAAEFLALTAMPANPTHQGLTAQGWNWPLADAKAYVQTCGQLLVGQMYVTDDGKTRAYITVEDSHFPEAKFRLYSSTGGTLNVDWGDGNTESFSISSRGATPEHTYASTGDYVIKVWADVPIYTAGYFLWYNQNGSPYSALLRRLEVGSNFTFEWGGTGDNIRLEYITLPIGCINSVHRFMNNSRSLKHINLPSGCAHASTTTEMFTYCFLLASISVPYDWDNTLRLEGSVIRRVTLPSCITNSNMTHSKSLLELDVTWPANPLTVGALNLLRKIRFINDNARSLNTTTNSGVSGTSMYELILPEGFEVMPTTSYAYSLTYMDLPSTITSIGNQRGANFLRTLVCRATEPPTASDANFLLLSYLEKIYVPYSSDHSVLAAYKAATNWSNYESLIFELDSNGNIPSA